MQGQNRATMWDGSGDRLAEALELKNEGNACFKREEAALAIAAYTRGIALLESEPPAAADDAGASGGRRDADDDYDLAVLFANRAAARLLALQQLLAKVDVADLAALPAADGQNGAAAEAERDARRAIALAPAYAKGYQRLSKALSMQGDAAGAKRAAKGARALAKGLLMKGLALPAAAAVDGAAAAAAAVAAATTTAAAAAGSSTSAATPATVTAATAVDWDAVAVPPAAPAAAAAATAATAAGGGLSTGAQLPPGSDVCALVRAGCCALFDQAGAGRSGAASPLVRIDDAAISELFGAGGPLAPGDGAARTRFEALAAAALPRFPLSFGTLESEINFWCVLGLLNFGSGYRRELHAACDGAGAFETVQRGVLGLYISGRNHGGRGLDAGAMAAVSLHGVGQAFGIAYEEEESAGGALKGAVFLTKPTALKPLAEAFKAALHESAAALKAAGHEDFASLVLGACRKRSGGGGGEEEAPSARRLVRALVETVPAFRDAQFLGARDDGGGGGRRSKVWIAKKAQLVAAHLNGALAEREPSLFGFGDLASLTVFADNVLPAVLRALGVLRLAPGLAARIDEADAVAKARGGAAAAAAGAEDGGSSNSSSSAAAATAAAAAAAAAAAPSWLRRGEEEGMLRAAAVAACERIVERAEGAFDARQLDAFLWKLGKEPQYRGVARHATKDTVYY